MYTDAEDAYTASPVSTLAPHLIDDPQYLAVSHGAFGLSDSYAALVLGNGDLALFSSNRSEKRAAWTNFTFNGRFSSVAAIHDRLFAMVYYEDKLQLCEFKDEVFIDNWKSITYNPTTYSGFTIMGIWVELATTVPIRVFTSHTLSVGDKVYFKDFENNAFWSAFDVNLEELNNTVKTVTSVDPTYFEFEYTLPTASESEGTLTITPSGSPEILQNSIVDMSQVYTALDDITFDVIYTENELQKHQAVTITGQSSNSDNIIIVPNLGIAGADVNSEVYVGTKFDSKLVTNPVDASLGNGPATGEVRGITNVVLDVKSTKSMKVNDRVALNSDFTGKKEVRLLGYGRNPQVTVEQDDPLSMQINGIVAELIV